MTNSNPHHHPFVLSVLQKVSTDRLQRAVNALADASLTVALTRQTEAEIRVLVKKGDGKEYGVTLTETGAFCSCPDALYRGVTCKHATVLALHTLRQPEERTEKEQPQALHVGDRVQQVENPQQQGQVVCVSGEMVSVWWERGRTEPCARTRVQLLSA